MEKLPKFAAFNKIPRLSRECVITEKIDGTNAQIFIAGDLILAGSRNRWLTPEADNFGFCRWVMENKEQLLLELGPGRHYGEWWGLGIHRGYGQGKKHFSLFDVHRWAGVDLGLCSVVPVLYEGPFDTAVINGVVTMLKANGSKAAVGFMNPEGVVVYHKPSGYLFKKTIEKDEEPKGAKQD